MGCKSRPNKDPGGIELDSIVTSSASPCSALNADVLGNIFAFACENGQQLLKLGEVNRLWYAVADDEWLWKQMLINANGGKWSGHFPSHPKQYFIAKSSSLVQREALLDKRNASERRTLTSLHRRMVGMAYIVCLITFLSFCVFLAAKIDNFFSLPSWSLVFGAWTAVLTPLYGFFMALVVERLAMLHLILSDGNWRRDKDEMCVTLVSIFTWLCCTFSLLLVNVKLEGFGIVSVNYSWGASLAPIVLSLVVSFLYRAWSHLITRCRNASEFVCPYGPFYAITVSFFALLIDHLNNPDGSTKLIHVFIPLYVLEFLVFMLCLFCFVVQSSRRTGRGRVAPISVGLCMVGVAFFVAFQILVAKGPVRGTYALLLGSGGASIAAGMWFLHTQALPPIQVA